MKKSLAFLIAILCLFTILSTSIEVFASDDYYSSTKGLSGSELLDELAVISQENHKNFNTYEDIRQMNAISDKDPNNSENLLDFYSRISVKSAWDSGVTWNREHVWPQSLSSGLYGEKGAGADVHHIRPTISSINSSRNNRQFTDFEVVELDYEEKYYNGTLVSFMTADYWEPLDEVKGDVARILMYLYMHYSKEVPANSSYSYAGNLAITNVVYTKNGADGAWDMLMDWNELDPVDEFEKERHDYCVSVTKVRNPFIDNEEYARLIWDEENVVGKERYSVTYNVSNGVLFNYVDNVRYLENSLVKEPTVKPSLEGYSFVGWYKEAECINEWNFNEDIITGNLNLYAKFTELTFKDIIGRSEIKSQLVFDIVKQENESSVIEEEMVISNFIKGEGSIAKGNFDLSEYLEFDTSLFNIEYKHNKSSSNNAYVNQSNKQIRLYPGDGDGSSIEIKANDGIKIKDVKCKFTQITPTITISSDGKTAKIHNTIAKKSGSENQVRVNSITIVYETMTKGYSYKIKEGSLAIKYNLLLTENEYYKFILADDDLSLYLNNNEYEYEVYKYGNSYRIVCIVYIDDYSKEYKPIFKYDDLTLTFDGYSAKTLAEYYLNSLNKDSLVKEYVECLEEIIG